ncbi:MAG: hypothetical protein IKL18_08725 [Oscillospiraceae bacterium]|nr:hypothetical protein [Oscillospiraceae bacterium]
MSENIKANSKVETIKKILWVTIIAVIVIIFAIIVMFALPASEEPENRKNNISINEIKGAKEYTREEYEALSPEEKLIFPDYFDDMEQYEEWYENNIGMGSNSDLEVPEMDLKDKDPQDFTLEDYNNLTPEEKAVFPDCFESMEDYTDWYNNVMSEQESEVPGINLSEKEPKDFTLEDYNRLSPEEKAVFPDFFDSMDEYKKWYNKVVKGEKTLEEVPSIDTNGKDSKDYTLEDYDKLTPAEKAVFPDCFESMEEYNEWYERVVKGNK